MTARDYIRQDDRLNALFQALPESEWNNIALKRYKKDECLIRLGEKAHALYIIVDGICSMERDPFVDCYPGSAQLGFLDVVGLYEIVHEVPRKGAVLAYRDCVVMRIPRETVLRWLDEYPRFLLELSTGIIRRLYREIDTNSECIKNSAYYGLIATLLNSRELFNRKTPSYSGLVKIDYTRQQLAEMTGKDVRSVNRAVEQLKRKGLIVVKHGKLYVNSEKEAMLRKEKARLSDSRLVKSEK